MMDAASYFHNLGILFQRARRRIMILGWDLHTELRLHRETDSAETLSDGLQEALKRNHELEVFVLIWHFSPIYFTERELFQKLKLSRRFMRRLHFVYDDQHPLGASHHQKIVVIDDEISFCGGIDLTANRWDESTHTAQNAKRVNPNGELYEPFHDLQIALTDNLAKKLALLARIRWYRATGRNLPALKSDDLASATWTMSELFEDPELRWDALLEAERCNFALTMPAYKTWPEIREVEASYRRLIGEAKEYIYIENQYLTSTLITELLSRRLSEPEGPAIVIILPELAEGFLEREAMLRLQHGCLNKLRKSDQQSRLRLLFPANQELAAGSQIKVHSKLIVVDDRYLQIGSANLNNRSMGLDTECDVFADFVYETQRQSLRRFLAGEIAHFCSDFSPDDIHQTMTEKGLLATVDRIVASQQNRRLNDLKQSRQEPPSWDEWEILDEQLLDWQHPLSIERLIDRTVYQPNRRKTRLFRSFSLRTSLTLVGILAFALVVIYLDLDLKAAFHALRESLNIHSESTLQNLLVAILIFSLGGIVMLPVNLLILTYASLFDGLEAISHILLGVAASASTGYGLGRLVSRKFLQKLIPGRFFEIAKKIRSRHLLPMILVRTAPVAPFSLINLLAGSFRVNFFVYFLGTMLGILPGVVSLVFFQNSLFELIKEPSYWNGLVFLLALGAVFYLFYVLNRRLSTPDEGQDQRGDRVGS